MDMDMTTWTDREKALYAQSEERLAVLNKMIAENTELEEYIGKVENYLLKMKGGQNEKNE
jgi:hypothetical protein